MIDSADENSEAERARLIANVEHAACHHRSVVERARRLSTCGADTAFLTMAGIDNAAAKLHDAEQALRDFENVTSASQ